MMNVFDSKPPGDKSTAEIGKLSNEDNKLRSDPTQTSQNQFLQRVLMNRRQSEKP